MQSHHINKDLFIVVIFITLIIFCINLINHTEKNYFQDNKDKAIRMRKELLLILPKYELKEYFSSTRGGVTTIKFQVKEDIKNYDRLFDLLRKNSKNFNFYNGCRDRESLIATIENMDNTQYIIIIWEYPDESCK